MADEVDKAVDAGVEPETPDAFLKALGNILQEKEGGDADLARILATHLLTSAPTKDAVAQAKEAITKLASERAAPKVEAGNG